MMEKIGAGVAGAFVTGVVIAALLAGYYAGRSSAGREWRAWCRVGSCWSMGAPPR